MQAVIFIGIQGSGKSTFYKQKFIDTHIRINLDMLKTRHREKLIFQACVEAKQSFVIDNTNPTPEDRGRYIIPAKTKGYDAIAYYFPPILEECKQRNNQRSGRRRIPLPGILATYKKLTLPSWDEGFDVIYSVETRENYSFIVRGWKDRV